jgi:aspartyl aminopeptidase
VSDPVDTSFASQAADLCRFLDAAPSPFHAVDEARRRLTDAGFTTVDERRPWPRTPGRYLLTRGGSLLAWAVDGTRTPAAGFRVVGAHTDSPNLRLKPRPDVAVKGWRQLGVEVYGGALLNSWLDRDLGLSGRIAVSTDGGVELRLVRDDRPLLRVPQLAIHLDRGVNDGLALNPQSHMTPVWGVGDLDEGGLARHLADLAGVEADEVLSWDVMVHDLTPSTLLGADASLLAGGRIDNLLSCHAAVTALLRAVENQEATGLAPARGPVPVICLFDHEEIGSESATGAAGALLPTVLERIGGGAGLDRDAWFAALAGSFCLSADGAHATHPNYPERHEPNHLVAVNAGPVVKANANVRYATDAPAAATVRVAASLAGVPLQDFVVRTDLPCGSTIGPVTSARLGIPTADVGVAQLSMHSARELCGAEDPEWFARLLTVVLGDPELPTGS